jgi:hypothetical protein
MRRFLSLAGTVALLGTSLTLAAGSPAQAQGEKYTCTRGWNDRHTLRVDCSGHGQVQLQVKCSNGAVAKGNKVWLTSRSVALYAGCQNHSSNSSLATPLQWQVNWV